LLGIKAIKYFSLKINEEKLKSTTQKDLRIKQSLEENTVYATQSKNLWRKD